LRETLLPNFACNDNGNYIKNHGVPFLRSSIAFGYPIKTDQFWDDIEWDDENTILEDDYAQKFYDLYTEAAKKVMEDTDEDMSIITMAGFAEQKEYDTIQQQDLSLTFASFIFVFMYMWFNTESFFIASVGMLQVLSSFLPAAIMWAAIDSRGMQFMQFLAIFMILGIGADDVFVLYDAWTQAKQELEADGSKPEVHQIFIMAYRRAFSAMFTTTATTAWAFLFGILNPIPSISSFCVFAAMVVIFDFLWCITLTASAIAFFERFMRGHKFACFGDKPEPGTCCQPGCCWGCMRIIWQKVTKTPPDQAPTTRFLDRFFEGPLFNTIKRFKLFMVIFWIVLLIAAIISAAVGVKLADKNPEGLPSDHPIQRANNILEAYFSQTTPEVVQVLWGLDKDEPVTEWSKTEEIGFAPMPTVKYGSTAAATSKEGQQKILALCKSPDLEAGRRCYSKSCLVKGVAGQCTTQVIDQISIPLDPFCQSGRYCLMEQVEEYTQLNNLAFPVDDLAALLQSAPFKAYMNLRFEVLDRAGMHWHVDNYKTGTGVYFEGNAIKYMWLSFNATFEGWFLPVDEGTEIFEDWEKYLDNYISGTDHFFVHIMFLFKILQDVLTTEAIKSIVISLCVAFVMLVLVTWNWYVSVLGTSSISCIIVFFVGMWPILGWDLDIYNVIFLIMAVGLSVDYTVHLLHAFNESPAESCEERAKDALTSMGMTVFSGAVTTLLAALPLTLCQSTFFKRFGIFVFIIIFLSIVLALTFLIPLLLMVGPTGSFGDVAPFYWLKDKIKGTQGAKVAPAEEPKVDNSTTDPIKIQVGSPEATDA
jgi:predicted RND superfamily exporter protein